MCGVTLFKAVPATDISYSRIRNFPSSVVHCSEQQHDIYVYEFVKKTCEIAADDGEQHPACRTGQLCRS